MSKEANSTSRKLSTDAMCKILERECGGAVSADEFALLSADEVEILYAVFPFGATLAEAGRLVLNKKNSKPAAAERIRQRCSAALRNLRYKLCEIDLIDASLMAKSRR